MNRLLLFIFTLSLVGAPSLAQTNFCANPSTQTRSEQGTPLTVAQFDDWLENVRYVCTSADVPADEECFTYEATGDTFEWQSCGTGGGGSSIILDLADDGANESTALAEIAITGDSNSIFSEPSADKLLIAVGNAWPVCTTATTANAGDSATAFFSSGTIEVARLPDATTGAKGIIQLAGDFGGTAALPSVSDDSHNHGTSTVSGLDISADTNLAVTAPITLTDDTIGLTQNAGTDVTSDLEEESHVAEHQDGGDDELSPLMQTIDTCTDGQLIKADIATGKWICGSAGSASFTTLDTDYGPETYTGPLDMLSGQLHPPGGASTPTSTDCDAAPEAGRLYVDRTTAGSPIVWVCEGVAGWVPSSGGGSAARGVHLRRVTSQSIPATTLTSISWDTESVDDDGFWSAGSPTDITIPESSWCTGVAYLSFSGTTAQYVSYLYIDGVQVLRSSPTGTTSVTGPDLITPIAYPFTVSQVVTIRVFISAARTLDNARLVLVCH